jgi:hypothetical protein
VQEEPCSYWSKSISVKGQLPGELSAKVKAKDQRAPSPPEKPQGAGSLSKGNRSGDFFLLKVTTGGWGQLHFWPQGTFTLEADPY